MRLSVSDSVISKVSEALGEKDSLMESESVGRSVRESDVDAERDTEREKDGVPDTVPLLRERVAEGDGVGAVTECDGVAPVPVLVTDTESEAVWRDRVSVKDGDVETFPDGESL